MYCGFAFSVACRDTLILPGSLLALCKTGKVAVLGTLSERMGANEVS